MSLGNMYECPNCGGKLDVLKNTVRGVDEYERFCRTCGASDVIHGSLALWVAMSEAQDDTPSPDTEYDEMPEVRAQIEEIVNRETRAWDTQDADLLLTIIHPDMVWPWPRTNESHDPMDWEFPFGRFNRKRWRGSWQDLFDNYTLVHNNRQIKKIVVSAEGDGAYAVVDIDTLWRHSDGHESHWHGRVCKVYTKMPDGDWKLIMHTGVLKY